MNSVLDSLVETRDQSGLPDATTWPLHVLLGLLISRQTFHFLISVLRVSPFASKFDLRVFFVLIEEFLYPLIDLVTVCALGHFFTQVSLFSQHNGLEALKQSSQNAKKFYARNTYLLSRNLEESEKNFNSFYPAQGEEEGEGDGDS
jgi:hypothetical protein